MPQFIQNISETSPKEGTFQYDGSRIAGLTLKLPSGVTEVSNRRIVSIQESSAGVQYAVPGVLAFTEKAAQGTTPAVKMKVLAVGVLEYALQSGGIDSIAPDATSLKDGDKVVVLSNPAHVYMVDYVSGSKPGTGKGDITDSTGAVCRVDNAGRLTSAASTTTAPKGDVFGSVFDSVPGEQLSNQLKDGSLFYRLFSPSQA